MLNKLAILGAIGFRRVLIISIILAVLGMVMLTIQEQEAVLFLEAFFIAPLLLSPFTTSFGKTLSAVITAALGTLAGALTLTLIGQTISGPSLAISLAVCTAINLFVVSEYTEHRKNKTVIEAVNNTFSEQLAPIVGGYLMLIISFSLSAFTSDQWLLILAGLLLHNLITTTLTLPASINLYEHYMAKRAITKFESKVLKMIKQFGSETRDVPILASWLGAGVEEVISAIENLRAKHYIVSNRFFYPSNTLMWFVGILSPLIGYSMANGTLPSIVEGLALLTSSTLIIFGLSIQKSWWLKDMDRLITHLMGFCAIALGIFFSLAISVRFSILMLLCSLLGIVICYLPEQRFHTARIGASIFYVLEFMIGWFANMMIGVSGIVYASLLLITVFTDVYLVKEEKYVKI